MARKKLSKVLAWTLAATMAISPVNITWASESADLFSDSSENVESVEIPADETDSQQGEVDTQSIVSSGEEDEDTFIAEDPVDVFSAGDESDDGNDSKKTITGAGTLVVKTNEEFNFIPKEAATYYISVDNEDDRIKINGSFGYGEYAIKTKSGYSYPICIESDTSDDITVTIEKIPSISGISVSQDLPKTLVYPVEPILEEEIDANLPVILTLDDESKIKGRYSGGVSKYGGIGIAYEDNGNLNFSRPTVSGSYKYHFYCEADPSIISETYTVELKTFEELFKENTVIKEDESWNVTLHQNAYIKTYDYGIYPYTYNYGFTLTADKDTSYCSNIDGTFIINSMNENGVWTSRNQNASDCFNVKAGKSYYIIYQTDEPIEMETTVLNLASPVDIVDNIEWISGPTKFIKEFTDDDYILNLGIKVKVTYKDGTSEKVFGSERSEKLGTFDYVEKLDENGQRYMHCYFSKNPSVYIDVPIVMVDLDEVEKSIPEIRLNESLVKIDRNFNNCNTFKFEVSQTGEYMFEVEGTPVSDIGLGESGIIVRDKDGKETCSSEYITEGLSFDAGDTVYISCGPNDGDFKVSVTQKNAISSIALENKEVLPTLYAEFLDTVYWSGDKLSNWSYDTMETLFRDAVFKVNFNDGRSKNVKLGETLSGYGKLRIASFGNYNEVGRYDIPVGPCEFRVFFEDIYTKQDTYSIGNLDVRSLADSENEIKGLSDSKDSSGELELSGNKSAKYFYIENTSDQSRMFNLNFVGHSVDDDHSLIAVTLNSGGKNYNELAVDDDSKLAVTLEPHAKMYMEYFGDATSVELSLHQIQVKSIQIYPECHQLINDISISDEWKLYFNVILDVDGTEKSIRLVPNEKGEYNLSLNVLFNGEQTFADDLTSGTYKITCCIPELDRETYISAGELEISSYKDFFNSPASVGTTKAVDSTKTYRNMNYIGFEIPEDGYYAVSLNPDYKEDNDGAMFLVTGVEKDYPLRRYEVEKFSNNFGYFNKGLLMVFAKHASNVSVYPATVEKLEELYNECSKLDSSDYKEESWQNLSDALGKVRRFLEGFNGPLDDDDFGDVSTNLNLLINAKNNLIKKHSYLVDSSTDENGWKVITPATCENAGTKVRTCKDEGCEYIETQSIPALGHDIDFSKNPQFIWEEVANEILGTIDGYGDISKYNAKADFYCKREAAYVEKSCNVSQSTVMGTNGSLSLLYTATVKVEEKTFTATKTIWLNKVDENKNSISTETNIDPGAPNTIIKGLDKEFVESLLSSDEKKSYDDSKINTDIKISTEIKNITETVSEEDASKVKAQLDNIIKNIAVNPEQKKIEYFDISMFKNVKIRNKSDGPSKIQDTKNEVTVELELSEEARNVPSGFTRNFYVIRIHDSKVDRLDATRNGNNLSFKTNKFSTYAVAYVDVKNNTSSPSYPSTPSYPVTDVTLSHDKADLTKVGETLQLTATVKPSYADNKTITWKSSDEKVATVDKDGKVTAVANGTATITATSADGKHSATATITVKIAPEKLTLTTENKMLTKIGDSLQITAKVEPDNAYDKLIWKSSDEKVATVDAEGKVTAVGNGEATITATTENGKFSESVTITVKLSNEPTINTITGYGNLKARSVTQSNNSIKVEWTRISGADGYIVYGSRCNGNGKVYKYKKLATITNGKTRTWTHTKLKKATYYKYIVKAYKLVDGKKVITDASVSIHAVTKGGNYGVAKTVSITKIGNKKNATEIILKKGKTAQITAVEVKKDKKIKHHRKLCYESSNTNVATVAPSGMIKATGKGSCTIWVYAQNGVYKAITVTVK